MIRSREFVDGSEIVEEFWWVDFDIAKFRSSNFFTPKILGVNFPKGSGSLGFGK